MNPNKKAPFDFGIKEHNVIKPEKHYFFWGEKHFSNPKDDRAITELIQLLQKEIVKPLHKYTEYVSILMIQEQKDLSVHIIIQNREAAALLEKKQFVFFLGTKVYACWLLLTERVIVVQIYLLKGISWGLDKIAKHPALALLVFTVLLGIVFSKWKKFKMQKDIEEKKKNQNKNQNLHPDDTIDPNDPPFFFPIKRRPRRPRR